WSSDVCSSDLDVRQNFRPLITVQSAFVLPPDSRNRGEGMYVFAIRREAVENAVLSLADFECRKVQGSTRRHQMGPPFDPAAPATAMASPLPSAFKFR